MKKLVKEYSKAMRKQFGQAAVWPPESSMELGDYGLYKDRRLLKRGNIFTDFSLDPKKYVKSPPTNPTTFSYIVRSEKSTSLLIKGAASGPTNKRKVELEVGFTSKRGFIIQLVGSYMEDMYLRDSMADAIANQVSRWRPEYRLVYARRVCSSLKYAFTLQSGAKIKLAAEANVGQSNASLDFSLESATNMNMDAWLTRGTATPLVDFASYSADKADFETFSAIAPVGQVFDDGPRLVPNNLESFGDDLLEDSEEESLRPIRSFEPVASQVIDEVRSRLASLTPVQS